MKKGTYKHSPETIKKFTESIKNSHKIKKWGFKKGNHTQGKGTLGKHWKVKDTSKKKGNHFWLGKQRSENTKEKMSLARVGRYARENCPGWRGGISFLPYSTDWTETLKRSIRERDHYICQICSGEGYAVHHIDYNKQNCNPINLITLCNFCHPKTNKNRDYWKNYFNSKG